MPDDLARKLEAVGLICRPFCRFFKEDKDEALACEGFNFIIKVMDRLPLERLRNLQKNIPARFEHDALLREVLCDRCEFLIDGCDFRDPACDYKAEPCGGYLLLDTLLKNGLISAGELLELRGQLGQKW